MAVELTANAVQTVQYGQNVLFTDTPVRCNKGYVVHRDGSGIVTLRGITCGNCFARYQVTFGGNIAAVGAVEPISLAIAIDGEPITSTTMTVTPAAVGEFFNVGLLFVSEQKANGHTKVICNLVHVFGRERFTSTHFQIRHCAGGNPCVFTHSVASNSAFFT